MKRINYAPGDYVCFCVDCDAEFMGHRLAVRCEQCAQGGEAGTAETHRGSVHEHPVAKPCAQTPSQTQEHL